MADVQVEAIIVAAGRGQRMGPRTAGHPKCLFKFRGRTLLEWQLAALRRAGIHNISIVGGYEHAQLKPFGLPKYVNPEWASSNMVHSLMSARDLLMRADEIVIAYADIVYEPRLLKALLDHEGDAVTVADENWLELWQTRFEQPLDDAETFRFADGDRIAELGNKPSSAAEIEAQYIGLTRLTRAGVQRFVAAHAGISSTHPGKDPRTCYFTDVLQVLASEADGLFAARTESGWLEFDSGDDIDAYDRRAAAGSLSTLWNPAEVIEQ